MEEPQDGQRGEKNETSGETWKQKSLFLFSRRNKVRRFLIWILTTKPFDWTIISLILLNSALLGIVDYTDKENSSIWNKVVEYSEYFFIVAFSVEFVIRVIAWGFIWGKGTYLRNAWNWLDFIVVITSYLAIHPSLGNISFIRSFRLFKPLWSVKELP